MLRSDIGSRLDLEEVLVVPEPPCQGGSPPVLTAEVSLGMAGSCSRYRLTPIEIPNLESWLAGFGKMVVDIETSPRNCHLPFDFISNKFWFFPL